MWGSVDLHLSDNRQVLTWLESEGVHADGVIPSREAMRMYNTMFVVMKGRRTDDHC